MECEVWLVWWQWCRTHLSVSSLPSPHHSHSLASFSPLLSSLPSFHLIPHCVSFSQHDLSFLHSSRSLSLLPSSLSIFTSLIPHILFPHFPSALLSFFIVTNVSHVPILYSTTNFIIKYGNLTTILYPDLLYQWIIHIKGLTALFLAVSVLRVAMAMLGFHRIFTKFNILRRLLAYWCIYLHLIVSWQPPAKHHKIL